MATQDQHQLLNKEQADKAFRANCSPRYVKLDGYEQWLEGRQYDGMPSWFDDDFPRWDRAPCIVYPVVDIAANSYVDLLLGNGRYPEFTTKPAENEADEENGHDEAESATIDRFIREWHRITRFRSVSRGSVYSSLGCGSCAVIHGVRNGRPFANNIPAKWCEPKLDADGAVLSLEIQYPYQEQYKLHGKWAVRARLYRRVIDAKQDTEYFPADAREDGADVQWTVNKDRSIEHGLGFCPVIWYPLMLGAVTVNVVDGKPIHKNVTDEIRQHDIARSQWHYGALMSEPQPYELGVAPGYNPTETGRTPLVLSTESGGENAKAALAAGKVTGGYGDPKPKTARKKGPGYVWQYTSPDTKVGALLYPSDALKAQEDNCRDLRIKLQESLSVIFLDPESIKFAATTSGKALEAIKQKQLDRCDQIRDDLTDRYFEPSISLQLRIAHAVLAKKQKLKVPGADAVKPLLDKLAVENDWQIPTLQTKWGPYFKPDVDEQQKLVKMVVEALDAGIPVITLRIAVQKLAPIFGIENVSAVLKELEEAAKKRRAEADESAAREQQRLHELAAGLGADDAGARSGSGGNSKETSAGRSGDSGSAAKAS